MTKTAPIALFVYNRLHHTRQTVEALKKNYLAQQSDLIVFSDSHKTENDIGEVFAVRDYIKNVSGFKSVNLIERQINFGLAKSIISGINQALHLYDRVIILEDDLVAAPYFLQFMNEGLNFYENDERVVSVNGYVYPVKKELPETFFLRCADCWGWAIWKRSWKFFEQNAFVLINKLDESGLIEKFNFNGQHDFYGMLQAQACGKINSWAIRWYASTFLANKLSLYPAKSLILNIGNDSSGVNCGTSRVYDSALSTRKFYVYQIPVQENTFVFNEFSKFFKSLRSESVFYSVKKIISKILVNIGLQ